VSVLRAIVFTGVAWAVAFLWTWILVVTLGSGAVR